MLGDPDRLEVLIYQFVYVVEGGARGASKRWRGDVVFLRELVEKIGIDGIMVPVSGTTSRESTYLAMSVQRPPSLSVRAHARIAGIRGRRKCEPRAAPRLAREEREVKQLAEFPETVAEATECCAPHAILYAIRVADDSLPTIAPSRAAEASLAPVLATRNALARSLDLSDRRARPDEDNLDRGGEVRASPVQSPFGQGARPNLALELVRPSGPGRPARRTGRGKGRGRPGAAVDAMRPLVNRIHGGVVVIGEGD